MINSSRLKLGKIKDCFLNIFKRAAERLFLTSLFLIFISLLIGLAVFYKYCILPQKIEPRLETAAVEFQENVYNEILQEWQNREEDFEAAKTKKYPDFFGD